MLVEQTMEKLVSMKLHGMAEALRRWLERPKEKDMGPADLVGLLADAEWNDREQKSPHRSAAERALPAGGEHRGHRLPAPPGPLEAGDARSREVRLGDGAP